MNTVKRLIDAAKNSGCDAVKFQKRTPEKCVPEHMRDQLRETPWGYISYLDYRYKIELGLEEFQEIDRYCKQKEITWFSSCWDEESVEFMEQFNPPVYKVASAMLTNRELLASKRATGRPIILSTGMSSPEQIRAAVDVIGTENLLIAHCTSTYPCPPEELNLRTISTLRKEYGCPIGYSGHETGLATTVAAVVLGASFIERHITLDRAMWGSDQSASVEPQGFARLVKDIRGIEISLGDGVKRVYESEGPLIQRLRNVDTLSLHKS
jgi:N-acetylneuraminate synthase